MKRSYISLLLSVLCLIMVFVVSIVDNNYSKLDIGISVIIFVSILVQIIAIIGEKNKKNNKKNDI